MDSIYISSYNMRNFDGIFKLKTKIEEKCSKVLIFFIILLVMLLLGIIFLAGYFEY